MAKPLKALKLHYPMIQFLIIHVAVITKTLPTEMKTVIQHVHVGKCLISTQYVWQFWLYLARPENGNYSCSFNQLFRQNIQESVSHGIVCIMYNN